MMIHTIVQMSFIALAILAAVISVSGSILVWTTPESVSAYSYRYSCSCIVGENSEVCSCVYQDPSR